jgi:hypothetical protein
MKARVVGPYPYWAGRIDYGGEMMVEWEHSLELRVVAAAGIVGGIGRYSCAETY